MKYGVRVLVGLLLGAASTATLVLTAGAAWVAAVVGALAAAVGFLGTFFVWSADRPQDGYEQVLFDRPNTMVTLALAGLMALGGLGGGLLGGPSLAPEELAAVASMEASSLALDHVLLDWQVARAEHAASNLSTEDLVATADEMLLEVRAVQADLQLLAVPETLAPLRESLTEQARLLREALEGAGPCAGGDTATCTIGRIALADAERQSQQYREALGAAVAG